MVEKSTGFFEKLIKLYVLTVELALLVFIVVTINYIMHGGIEADDQSREFLFAILAAGYMALSGGKKFLVRREIERQASGIKAIIKAEIIAEMNAS